MNSHQPFWLRHRYGLAALAIFGILLLAKIFFISRYGSSLPFWDQWGGESGLLYRPIVQGTFEWSTLWAAHNEHRIFFTRLVQVALFLLNQNQWDPMVQVYFNSVLHCAVVAISLYWLQRRLTIQEAFVVTACAFCAVLIPNGWDNTLVGFQNCFYFLIAFSMLAIVTAAKAGPAWFGALVLSLFCVAAFFSLASGLITALATIVVIAVRAICRQLSLRWSAVYVAGPLLLFSVGLLTLPQLPTLEVLRATDFREFLQGFAIAAKWPIASPLGLLQWIPLLMAGVRLLRQRRAAEVEIVLIGLSSWSLLVCASIAYSRGHGLGGIESRYTDILVIGFIANATLLFRQFSFLLRDHAGSRRWMVAVSVVAAFAFSLMKEWDHRSVGLLDRSGRMEVAASNVSRYLAGDQGAIFDRPMMYIPTLPSEASGLASMLSDPVIVDFLPFSLKAARVEHHFVDRSCRWLPETVPPVSDQGMSCSLLRSERTGMVGPGLSVGPLSAVAFGLWKLAYSDWRPRFQAGAAAAGSRSGGNVAVESMACNIEKVNDEVAAEGGRFPAHYSSAVKLDGWAGPRSSDAPIRLELRAGNGAAFHVEGYSSLPRPDVSAYLKEPRLSLGGFGLWVDASIVPAGVYDVIIRAGNSSPCAVGGKLEITDGDDALLRY